MVSGGFSMTMTVDTSRVLAMLEKASIEKIKNVDKAIHNAGFLLEGEIRASIAGQRAEPRSFRTGWYAKNVWNDATQPLVSRVYTNVEYAFYLEEGTSFIFPRHHFRNSMLRKRREMLEMIENALKID